MHTPHTPPTGRRKVTPRQLRAELDAAEDGPPRHNEARGRILAAFKRAEPALGLPHQVTKLVDYLVGCTKPQDWDGTGLGPIAWPSDATLEDVLCVGPTQRKAIVRAALDAGVIRMRRSPNGRRDGRRDKQGRIIDAYGFDLAPLAERMEHHARLAAEWKAMREEGKRLRREIASARNEVLALVDLARLHDVAGNELPGVVAQVEALWQARGAHRDPFSLLPIAARLRALLVRFKEQVGAALADVSQESRDPTGAEYRPQNTTTKHLSIGKPITADANATLKIGADAQGGQEERSRADRQEGRPCESGGVDALRGFQATPAFVIAVAPLFQELGRTARPGWSELDTAAAVVCRHLGINGHAWAQARAVLGIQAAILALAAIVARHARGEVQRPGGLLRAMTDRHLEGTLRLDRTLFGLADGLTRQRQGAGPPGRRSADQGWAGHDS